MAVRKSQLPVSFSSWVKPTYLPTYPSTQTPTHLPIYIYIYIYTYIKDGEACKDEEHAKGLDTYLVASSVGSSTHPSTRCVCFLMALTSITISYNLPHIVWHRWLGAAGLTVLGGVCVRATSVLSTRDSTAWRLLWNNHRSLILINPLILYGKVLLHKTKFHPNSPLILCVMILNLERYIRNFTVNNQRISSPMKPLLCTDLCFAIASVGAFTRTINLIS